MYVYVRTPNNRNCKVVHNLQTGKSHPRLKQLLGAHTMSFRSRGSYTEHDMLACDICLEKFNDRDREAKFLCCHHSFCLVCLTQLKNSAADCIECPTCRHPTALTEAGVAGLQTNFYITYMRETFHKLGSPKVRGCSKHSQQPMSFFCQKCGTAICRDCTVLDHKEADGHAIQDIMRAQVQQRQALATCAEESRAALSGLQVHMQHLEVETAHLTAAKEAALRQVEDTFSECAKALEYRRLQLSKGILDLYSQRQELLLGKMESLSEGFKELSTRIEHCDRLVKTGALSEVVSSKRGLSRHLADVSKTADSLQVGHNYLTFQGQAGLQALEESVATLGSFTAEESLPTHVSFQPQELVAGLRSKVLLSVYSYDSELLRGYPVTVVISDPAQTHIANTITAHPKGHYVVTFVPQMSGEHRLVAAFLGQPIKGAETTVKVNSNNPVQKFGEQGNGQGKFLSPRAVAVDKDGSMYIADTGNRLIQKIDANGGFLHQFCINTEKPNRSTCDLALNSERGLIVCTETLIGAGMNNPTSGNVVMVYGRDGHLHDVFTNKVMKCALCIATNSRGAILVSDYVVHRVFMYDEHGAFVRRLGHAFNHPAFICIDDDDRIIVSDTNADCVHVFDPDGKFLHQFGRSGAGKGELRQPFGVAADKEHILVVDSGNRRVQVFTKDGQFVSLVESADDPLEQPRGMAVTEDGYVYVADRDNHCIKKYRYKST